MASASMGHMLVGILVLVAACGNERRTESVGMQAEALSVVQARILGFEGSIGGSSGDWRAVSGTATSTTVHSEGVRSLSLSNSTSASARSTALSTLGTVAPQAGIDVQVPTSLQGQGWYGQVALTLNAPSAGVHNIHVGAVSLAGPVGTFRRYAITLPSFVVTALNTQTYSDLTITVQLNVPNTSGAFLLDALTLTSGGVGGTGGSGGLGGSGGAPTGGTATGGTATGGTATGGAPTGGATGGTPAAGAGGTTGGGAGTSGGGAGGSAGNGGAVGSGGGAGISGGAGSAGSTGTALEELFIELPKDLEPEAVGLGAYGNGGGLVINDGTRVVEPSGAFANVTSARTTVATDLGVNTQVMDVYSTPNIFVRGTHIHGNVWTASALVPSPQQASVIDGTVQHHVSLEPIRRLSWTVPFPTFAGLPIEVPQGGTLTLEPGGTRGITLLQNARLRLDRPGVYTLDGPFVMEPSSVLEIDNAAGQVELYVRRDFIFRGAIQKTDPRDNVLIGVLGTGDQPIERRFNAILVAPRGTVQLGTVADGHQTSVFAKSILARPNTTITHIPFDPAGFCEAERCSGLCPVVTGSRECSAGEPCSNSDDCANGLVCQGGVCAACSPDVCTSECPCPPGGPGDPCSGNADCGAGTVCGLDNGGRFGRPVEQDSCWAEVCEADPLQACGAPTSPCGLCEDHPVCETNAQCPSGLACGEDVGPRFGLPLGVSVCWSTECETNGNVECGLSSSKCGLCLCIPDCEDKACGDVTDDGCGGTCPGLCDDGEPGCNADWECPVGSSCGIGAGPDFGLDAGTNVCWPVRCNDKDPQVEGCGVGEASCGTCPACVPSCDDRQCGSDGCGGDCGTCATGESCNPLGECVPPVSILDHTPDFPIPLPDADAAEVGTLAGAFSVSDRGAANYTIPIAVPPGRSGFEPRLSLVYDGSKREGLMGPGWRIAGLSAITLCPTTLSAAAYTGPVFYPGSNFCLDGQQLVLVPEALRTVGPDDWEFRTEVDTFAKIVGRNTENGEPEYFELFTKDGRVLQYGREPGASVRRKGFKRVWALDSARDRAGNTLSVQYKSHATAHEGEPGGTFIETGELLPETISYGSHTNGLAGDQWAEFDYEDRPDPKYHFVDGARGFSLRRLTSVTTVIGGNPVRKYVVSYAAGAPQSRVESVEECSGNGARCKPATTFDYEPPGSYQPIDSSWLNVGTSEEIVSTLDQDGDGRTDVVVWVPNSTQVRVIRPRPQPDGTIVGDSIGVPWTTPAARPDLVIDVNRDGRDDLIDPTGRVLVSDLSFFREETFERPPGVIRSAVVLDGDGDGLRDLMLGIDDRIAYFKSAEDHLRDGVLSFPVPGGGGCTKMVAIDVDGDQSEEILCVSLTGDVAVAEVEVSIEGTDLLFFGSALKFGPASEVKVLDFNGDGLRDIIEARSTSYDDPSRQLSVWESTGKGFWQKGITTTTSGDVPSPREGGEEPTTITYHDLKESVVLDHDGDGRDDLLRRCCRGPSASEADQSLLVYRATGRYEFEVSNTGLGNFVPTLADVNGDGSSDILAKIPGGAVVALGTASKAGLLRTVTDGLGKRIQVKYEASTPEAATTDSPLVPTFDPRGCAQTIFQLPEVACSNRAPALVSEHTESAGEGVDEQRARRYVYTYRTARQGLLGRGPHGFAFKTVLLLDDANQVFATSVSNFYTEHALAGLLRRKTTTYATVPENALSLAQRIQTETFNHVTVGISAAGRPFPRPSISESVVQQLGMGPVERRAWAATIDDYGDLLNSIEQVYKGESVLIEETTTDVIYYPNDLTDWKIGLPQDVSVTNTRGGETVARTNHYEFYDSGLLRKTIREMNDDYLRLDVELVRNAFGNVEQITSTDADGEVRSQVVDYDSQEIFPIEIANAEGHVVEVRFHPATGQLQTHADPNRVIYQRVFDDFGRLVEVRSPDDRSTIQYESATPFDDPLLGRVSAVVQTRVTALSGGQDIQRHDAFGRAVSTESTGFDGTPIRQETAYDWNHRIVRGAMPHEPGNSSQGIVQVAYDAAGRLTESISADGLRAETLFASHLTLKPGFSNWLSSDDSLYISALVKPRTNIEARVTDHRGASVSSLEAEGLNAAQVGAAHQVRFVYRPFGGVREIHDQLGNVTTFGVDRLGRAEEIDDPDSGHQHRVFSAWNEPIEITDAHGVTRTRMFDRLGRLRRILGPDEELIAEWVYDGPSTLNQVGRLLSAFREGNPGGALGNTLRYIYEAPISGLGNTARLSRVEHDLQDEVGDPITLAVGYTYDSFGRTDVISYPGAGSSSEPFDVRHEYDLESGMLEAVRHLGTGAAFWELLEADQGFRVSRERFGNGVESRQTYYSLSDPSPACVTFGELACPVGVVRSVTVAAVNEPDPILDLSYEYDWNLNLKTQSRTIAGALEKVGFDYDLFDQLFEHYRLENGGASPVASFRYDALGNIESQTGVGAYDYTGSGRPHAIFSIGDTIYTHDNAGNQIVRDGPLVAGGYQTLDYNDFNMPWRITTGDPGIETVIEYDAFEGRVAKRQPDEQVMYMGDLYERVSTNGQVEHRYKVFVGSEQVVQATKTEVSGVITDTSTAYLHSDHLGSASALTDENGELVEPPRLFGPFGTADGDVAASGVRAGFTGHEHDSELGLINMRGRLYDPVLGQFLQPDPLIGSLNPRAFNSYAYVMNNPLVRIDPSGFSFLNWFGSNSRMSKPIPSGDENQDGLADEGIESSGSAPNLIIDLTETHMLSGSTSPSGDTGSPASAPNGPIVRYGDDPAPGPSGPSDGYAPGAESSSGSATSSSGSGASSSQDDSDGPVTWNGGGNPWPSSPGSSLTLGGPRGSSGVGSHQPSIRSDGNFLGQTRSIPRPGPIPVPIPTFDESVKAGQALVDGFVWLMDTTVTGARDLYRWLMTPTRPFPGMDPTRAPGVGWEWRGRGPVGSPEGNWVNPKDRGEYLHPDLGHPAPIGPHWDWRRSDGTEWRIFPDGRVEPK
jgi:RHS repeat-associated protein